MDPQIEETLRTWQLAHLCPKFEEEKMEWATFLELEDGDLKQLCATLNDLVKLRKQHRLLRPQQEDTFATEFLETVGVSRKRPGIASPRGTRIVEETNTNETGETENNGNVTKCANCGKQRKRRMRHQRRAGKKKLAEAKAKATAQENDLGSASGSGSVPTDGATPPSPSEGPEEIEQPQSE